MSQEKTKHDFNTSFICTFYSLYPALSRTTRSLFAILLVSGCTSIKESSSQKVTYLSSGSISITAAIERPDIFGSNLDVLPFNGDLPDAEEQNSSSVVARLAFSDITHDQFKKLQNKTTPALTIGKATGIANMGASQSFFSDNLMPDQYHQSNETEIKSMDSKEIVLDNSWNLEVGTHKVVLISHNPTWYAPDSYYANRKLPTPPAGSSERFLKGALGKLAIYLTNGMIIHSANEWSEEISGAYCSEIELERLAKGLTVGSVVYVN